MSVLPTEKEMMAVLKAQVDSLSQSIVTRDLIIGHAVDFIKSKSPELYAELLESQKEALASRFANIYGDNQAG